ncbi:hypothetical protein T484DRAFT_1792527 [Baffinella frigidus]|nr:hypothetical protein T484DRAFT_1792527 [Cryptophyta sp. CCMP2293]
MALPDGGAAGNKATVIFNACKGEKHHTVKGFKQLTRRLKTSFNVREVTSNAPVEEHTSKQSLAPAALVFRRNKDGVDPAALSGGQIAVFGGPREKFKKAEIDAALKITVALFPAAPPSGSAILTATFGF